MTHQGTNYITQGTGERFPPLETGASGWYPQTCFLVAMQLRAMPPPLQAQLHYFLLIRILSALPTSQMYCED